VADQPSRSGTETPSRVDRRRSDANPAGAQTAVPSSPSSARARQANRAGSRSAVRRHVPRSRGCSDWLSSAPLLLPRRPEPRVQCVAPGRSTPPAVARADANGRVHDPPGFLVPGPVKVTIAVLVLRIGDRKFVWGNRDTLHLRQLGDRDRDAIDRIVLEPIPCRPDPFDPVSAAEDTRFEVVRAGNPTPLSNSARPRSVVRRRLLSARRNEMHGRERKRTSVNDGSCDSKRRR
jgi:hypothetical protein